jgi:multidrug efflux pump subunit AcrA (membrane-fusion protein)
MLALTGCGALGGLAQPLPVSLPARFTNAPLAVGSTLYPVERGRVVRTLEFTGLVRANTEHDLYFPVGGGVARVLVKSGDRVAAGDLIAELAVDDAKMDLVDAEIEAELAELRLAEATNELQAAQAEAQLRLEAAQLEWQRLQLDTRTTSSDLQLAEHALRVAEAEVAQVAVQNVEILGKQLEAAQAQVARAQLYLDRLSLRAPLAGTVRLSQELRVGQAVEAYTLVGRVVDSGTLIVESQLESNSLELLATTVHQQMNLTTLSGYSFGGSILTLPQPYGDGSTPYVQIAPVASADGLTLREGINVVVRVQIASPEDVLLLPNNALQIIGGRAYVVVQEADALRDQEVALGLQGDTHTQIVEGLTDGMIVVAP